MSELIQHNNAPLAAPQKPRFPRPSRRWKAPSNRDLWIFKKIEIEGKTHQAVARDAGIRRSRVTQIVTRVRRYLADDLDTPKTIAALDGWATDALDYGGKHATAPDLVRTALDALLGVDL